LLFPAFCRAFRQHDPYRCMTRKAVMLAVMTGSITTRAP
jgi:hypothetical protein